MFVEGCDCFIVDDMVMSGMMFCEIIDVICLEGGEFFVCVVIVDK